MGGEIKNEPDIEYTTIYARIGQLQSSSVVLILFSGVGTEPLDSNGLRIGPYFLIVLYRSLKNCGAPALKQTNKTHTCALPAVLGSDPLIGHSYAVGISSRLVRITASTVLTKQQLLASIAGGKGEKFLECCVPWGGLTERTASSIKFCFTKLQSHVIIIIIIFNRRVILNSCLQGIIILGSKIWKVMTR